jgi:hypothetical protein
VGGLPPEAVRMFELLGVHPGPDFTAPAAASLAAVSLFAAHRVLGVLADANLIADQRDDRFGTHDLLRAYAAEQAGARREYFASHEKLASWVTLCPGNYMSAGKRAHGRTGTAGTYIKPMLVQAAWSAVKTEGRLQAWYHKLVRRFGGPKNRTAVKKAILAIAHTLLKIAYQVLRSGRPYEDLGADFYARRDSPDQRRAHLLRQLEELSPGCTVTITPAEAA